MNKNLQPPKKLGLLPQLGLYTSTAIVIGAVIGSGIFKKPAFMANALGSPELMLLVWVVAGLITLFGALTNAEVAGLIPKTGGQFIFFREMYGDMTGYLYGWAMLSVVQCGSIASITYVFSEYLQYFFTLPRFSPEIEQQIYLFIPGIGKIFPLMDLGVKSVTILLILSLSFVNYLGVKFGGSISAFFTTAKVAAMGLLIGACFIFSDGSVHNLTTANPNFHLGSSGMLGGIIVALSAAFWAYDGWNNITYLAGEIKNPKKNVPLALTIGIVVVISVYLLMNVAFLYVLPTEVMAGSKLVAADAAKHAIGASGGALVAILVMVSTFGTANGTIMASARVYYAMARKNLFFHSSGNAHPKFRTPSRALAIQAFWASALVLSGSFDNLTDMLIFVSWIFYALGAYGVFILRKKMPNHARPYKVWGYPYVPIIFIIFATAFVLITLYNDILNYYSGNTQIINSLFGLLLVSLGIPLYVWFKKRNKNKEIRNDDVD